ncbi:MAG: PAS domain S-box protein [Magnetococcales bacterium]|nr:PAS domain S-box protein [Magnetococcales bacterium]
MTTWALLDHWQTSHLQTLFQERLREIVGEKAEINRVVFDQHVQMHQQAVNLLVVQRTLLEYLEQRDAPSATGEKRPILFHNGPPVWLPKSSVLRGMVPLRYVLLLDGHGQVREVFQGQLDPPPAALLQPASLLPALSHGQPLITAVDGTLFLLTSESVLGRDGQPKAMLMLASPLDGTFLTSSQGLGGQYTGIVALLEGSQPHIVASNQPQVAPPGLPLERLLGSYLVAGQSFFDYGASDLLLQLITLVSSESFDSLTRSILQVEREQRLIGASVLILVCLCTLLWVTHTIRQVTHEIMDFSRNVLGRQPGESRTRDELSILRERFQSLAHEIVQTRDRLHAELEERKRAELEVRKLSQAVEQSPAGVMICDLTGRIVYVNKQFTRMTGYEPAEILGKNPRLLQSGETPSATYQAMWKTIANGKVWHGELHNRRKDGSVYWELNTISHIHAPNQLVSSEDPPAGSISINTFYLAIKEDISSRIAMEKDLQQAKEAAETVNQVKDDFLSNISHELRTPLNTIAGCTSVMLDADFGELNKNQRKYLHNIQSSAERLSDLISDLLDLSKVNSEQFTLEKSFFELSPLVQALGESVAEQVAEKGLTFVSHLDAEVPERVKGDPVRLRQVLMHIVRNAIKFTPAGQVKLSVTRDDSRHDVPVAICFTVTDTGIGIPEEKQRTIFELFMQVDSSSSRRYEGTGLGLTIAKRLIELMGGAIHLKSRVDEGSVFAITIPFDLPPVAPGPDITDPLPAGLRAAVIGKNPVNRLILKKLLTSLGLEVSEFGHCHTPEELQEMCHHEAWDFVCLECIGTEAGGSEEIARIRAETALADLPIILFSNVPTEQRAHLEQIPRVYCLDRPMQRTQLCKIVWQAIDRGERCNIDT